MARVLRPASSENTPKQAMLGRALGAQLVARDRVELVEVADHGGLQARGHRGGVAVRAAQRLLDDLVDQPELASAGRR